MGTTALQFDAIKDERQGLERKRKRHSLKNHHIRGARDAISGSWQKATFSLP